MYSVPHLDNRENSLNMLYFSIADKIYIVLGRSIVLGVGPDPGDGQVSLTVWYQGWVGPGGTGILQVSTMMQYHGPMTPPVFPLIIITIR